MSNTVPERPAAERTMSERRRDERRRMLMSGRCRIAPGQSPEVWLIEISRSGCQITVREGLLARGQHVLIKTGGIAGLAGTVRWTRGEVAGIEFDEPLQAPLLELMVCGCPDTGECEPSELVDQFGRRMPSWPRKSQSGSRSGL
jgi:hypothetical protein